MGKKLLFGIRDPAISWATGEVRKREINESALLDFFKYQSVGGTKSNPYKRASGRLRSGMLGLRIEGGEDGL